MVVCLIVFFSLYSNLRILEHKGIIETRKLWACYGTKYELWKIKHGGRSAVKEARLSVEFKEKMFCAKHLQEASYGC